MSSEACHVCGASCHFTCFTNKETDRWIRLVGNPEVGCSSHTSQYFDHAFHSGFKLVHRLLLIFYYLNIGDRSINSTPKIAFLILGHSVSILSEYRSFTRRCQYAIQ